MKINFAYITQFRKRIRDSERKEKKGLLNVSRDWTIVLISVVALNIISIGFHAVFFLDTREVGQLKQVDTSDNIQTINRTEINKVLTSYEEKEIELERLKQVVPRTPDPAQ